MKPTGQTEIKRAIANPAIVLYLMFFLSLSSGFAQNQFQLTLPAVKEDLPYEATAGYSIQQTADGGYIVCAGVTGAFTAGGEDVYLVKFTSTGTIAWTKTYGGAGNDYGRSVQQTPDGGYIIAGYTTSFGVQGTDVFLLKTDGSGNLTWAKTYGGNLDDGAVSVKHTADGGYIIAGYTASAGIVANNNIYTYGNPPVTYYLNDSYFIKTNSTGDTLWTRVYGNTANPSINGTVVWLEDEALAIQQTLDGGYVVTGDHYGFGETEGAGDVYMLKMDGSGNKKWAYTYEYAGGVPGTVQQTSDKGYVFSLSEVNGFGTPYGVKLFKMDSLGMGLWVQQYSQRGGNYGNYNNSYVSQTADNGYIVTGNLVDNSDSWDRVSLIKTNSTGVIQSLNTYAADSNTTSSDGWNVQQTSDGGYIIGGYRDGDNKIYLIKTDASYSSGCNQEAYTDTTISTGTFTPPAYPTNTKRGGAVVTSPTVTVGSGGSKTTICSTLTLPIELLYFDAKKDGSAMRVKCDWSTASETNSNYFAVERSQDGVNFSLLGTLQGAGTTSTTNNYTFYDQFPYSGWSYYRLKQVDDNGNYSYSPVSTVYIGSLDITTLYPNPATDNLTVLVSTEQNTEGTMDVYNVMGQIVYSSNVTLQKGQTEIKIPVGRFANGQYLLKATLPSGDYTQKVFMK